MSESKRKCIFTNKPSNARLNIGQDKHNWARSVPCTKEYLKQKGDRALNELEIRLIEIFYQQELCKLRIEQYDTQMSEIRGLLQKDSPVAKTNFDLAMDEYHDMAISPEYEQELFDEESEEEAEKSIAQNHATEEELAGLPDEEKAVDDYAQALTKNFKEAAEKTGIADKLYNKDLVEKSYTTNEEAEDLTEEKRDDKVKKKVVKKKDSSSLWD